jgi:hypothetical protein
MLFHESQELSPLQLTLGILFSENGSQILYGGEIDFTYWLRSPTWQNWRLQKL